MRNATSADWAEFLTDMQSAASVEAEGIGQILAMAGNPNDPVATAMGRTNVIYQLSVDDPATYASAWSDFSASDNLQEGSCFISIISPGIWRSSGYACCCKQCLSDLLAKHYLTSHRQWRDLMYFFNESVASELLKVGW